MKAPARAFTVPLPLLAYASGVISLSALPVVFPVLRAYCRYERISVLSGEWWPLFTANLVHTNTSHWWLNMSGLLLTLFLFETRIPAWRWLAVLIFSGFASTAGLLLLPNILWYVGLSGALHGLFCYGALTDFRQGYRLGLGIFAVVAGKLAWEHWHGAEQGVEALISAKVVTEAHLWGGLGGTLLAFTPLGRLKKPE